jgi:hypothetical protein
MLSYAETFMTKYRKPPYRMSAKTQFVLSNVFQLFSIPPNKYRQSVSNKTAASFHTLSNIFHNELFEATLTHPQTGLLNFRETEMLTSLCLQIDLMIVRLG